MARAFTLIELLVVITILLILAGLTLAVVNLVKSSVQATETRLAFQTIQVAMAQARNKVGGVPSAVEHPLAGSREDRWAFVRADGSTALTASATAVRGLQPSEHASPGTVLLDDDRYADPRLPLLYGLRRDECTVLGAELAAVTAYERWGRDLGGTLKAMERVVGTGSATQATQVLNRFLALSTGGGELSRQGLLAETPDDVQLILGQRVWSDGSRRFASWAEAQVGKRPGSVVDDGAGWTGYRLRGLALYDGWGREILYGLNRHGEFRLMSAGRDGVFRHRPGPGGALPGDPTLPGGGETDNLASAWEAGP